MGSCEPLFETESEPASPEASDRGDRQFAQHRLPISSLLAVQLLSVGAHRDSCASAVRKTVVRRHVRQIDAPSRGSRRWYGNGNHFPLVTLVDLDCLAGVVSGIVSSVHLAEMQTVPRC